MLSTSLIYTYAHPHASFSLMYCLSCLKHILPSPHSFRPSVCGPMVGVEGGEETRIISLER